jgi:hypothetical protein
MALLQCNVDAGRSERTQWCGRSTLEFYHPHACTWNLRGMAISRTSLNGSFRWLGCRRRRCNVGPPPTHLPEMGRAHQVVGLWVCAVLVSHLANHTQGQVDPELQQVYTFQNTDRKLLSLYLKLHVLASTWYAWIVDVLWLYWARFQTRWTEVMRYEIIVLLFI